MSLSVSAKKFKYRYRVWLRWVKLWEKNFGQHYMLRDPEIHVNSFKPIGKEEHIVISLREGGESVVIGEQRYPKYIRRHHERSRKQEDRHILKWAVCLLFGPIPQHQASR